MTTGVWRVINGRATHFAPGATSPSDEEPAPQPGSTGKTPHCVARFAPRKCENIEIYDTLAKSEKNDKLITTVGGSP